MHYAFYSFFLLHHILNKKIDNLFPPSPLFANDPLTGYFLLKPEKMGKEYKNLSSDSKIINRKNDPSTYGVRLRFSIENDTSSISNKLRIMGILEKTT